MLVIGIVLVVYLYNSRISYAVNSPNNQEKYTDLLNIQIDIGGKIFLNNWNAIQGGGHLHGKDPFYAVNQNPAFQFAFNLTSTPKVNSCFGCHVSPFGEPGGSGQLITNVIASGEQLRIFLPDHMKMQNKPVHAIINSNATLHAFGVGFVEMLARQITQDLQAIRNDLNKGESRELKSKGIHFGVLGRRADGSWDTSKVEGLSIASTASSGPDFPPSLVIQPFHQDGAVVSIRQFTINAFDFHLGMQAVERFGTDTDPDEDGVKNELSIDDLTAITLYQATLPVPGRVIPSDKQAAQQVRRGESVFSETGCSACHIPSLPLDKKGWIFTEPNPFNPYGNLQVANVKAVYKMDLTSTRWPQPRLTVEQDVVNVPLFTDFKLHDITSGPDDPNRDPLNMHTEFGSEAFFAGTSRFLTARLWGFANQVPYFHNGRYTMIEDAILAHAGEASETTHNYRKLPRPEQEALIAFLHSLQILPPQVKHRVVDETGRKVVWPPAKVGSISSQTKVNVTHKINR